MALIAQWRELTTAAIAMAVLYLAVPSRARAAVAAATLGALAIWAVWGARVSMPAPTHTPTPTLTLTPVTAAPPGGSTDTDQSRQRVDPELFTLRRQRASAGAPHTALRPDVLAALAALAARFRARSHRGATDRASACLEDFFARYDRALLSDDADLAARTVPVLVDTRTSALNSIHDLAFAAPQALTKDVEAAIEVVRQSTQACLAVLARKYRRSPGMRAAWWRPPYAADARRDLKCLH